MNRGSPTGLVMLGWDPLDKPRPFLGARGLGLPSPCSELSLGKPSLVLFRLPWDRLTAPPGPVFPGGLLFPWTPSWGSVPQIHPGWASPPEVLMGRSGMGTWTCTFVKTPGSSAIGPGLGFPGGTNGKEPTCQRRRRKRCGFYPCSGKIPRNRKW